MDCMHILKYLNLFLTTLFTFLMALFALFQWMAVEKQNRQSLFKMRMEHYIKYKNILIEIASLNTMDVNKKDKIWINKDDVNKLIIQLKILIVLVEESEFLFNKTISNDENKISKELTKIKNRLQQNEVSQFNIYNECKVINDMSEKLNTEFSKFLLKVI